MSHRLLDPEAHTLTASSDEALCCRAVGVRSEDAPLCPGVEADLSLDTAPHLSSESLICNA